ncbi:MAG TPA: hypothetical protein PK878_14835 [bacterium]|nr:hypothetical protein [Candidatus Omnitrophota bacterium]HOJ61556.1 hypothetical protein [bacterium]HOL93400.1 hypothetical protein [bacterium]HPO98944.1 hypothetical protein [bacterium]HXK95949.1 hypothetical protein [bacterium]
MKFEYITLRYLSRNEHVKAGRPEVNIKTPSISYTGTMEEVFKQLGIGGEPSLVGLFNFFGNQGWRLHSISKNDMYFFEREIK